MANGQLNPEEIKKRAKNIDEVGKRYLQELKVFKKKQRDLLLRFVKELEKRKIEEIKKSIHS